MVVSQPFHSYSSLKSEICSPLKSEICSSLKSKICLPLKSGICSPLKSEICLPLKSRNVFVAEKRDMLAVEKRDMFAVEKWDHGGSGHPLGTIHTATTGFDGNDGSNATLILRTSKHLPAMACGVTYPLQQWRITVASVVSSGDRSKLVDGDDVTSFVPGIEREERAALQPGGGSLRSSLFRSQRAWRGGAEQRAASAVMAPPWLSSVPLSPLFFRQAGDGGRNSRQRWWPSLPVRRTNERSTATDGDYEQRQ
nr:Retrovirus-related Pol polyprotein from transposon 17.6 [Ipomoea batatas]